MVNGAKRIWKCNEIIARFKGELKDVAREPSYRRDEIMGIHSGTSPLWTPLETAEDHNSD